MPRTLPNLYCSPADLMDYLTTAGVELRLDDARLATGQTVRVLADALAGVTSLSVTALLFPILRGTQLTFDGGNMLAPVSVTPTVTAKAGDVALTVAALATGVNQDASARDSGVTAARAALAVKACSYATARVKLYCCGKYQDSDLATTWSANRWATALGAQWLCRRAGQPAPESVDKDAEESLEEMKQVSVGMLCVEDVGTRTSGWPFISNVSVDPGYTFHKSRVEQSISELTPVQYPQYVEWNDALGGGFEW